MGRRTEQGILCVEDFRGEGMKKIKHNNHLWRKYDGTGTADKNNDDIDICAYEAGYHNDPRCIVCGYGFCHHCYPEEYDSECEVGYFTCENCGGIIDEVDKFCKHCGIEFEQKERD